MTFQQAMERAMRVKGNYPQVTQEQVETLVSTLSRFEPDPVSRAIDEYVQREEEYSLPRLLSAVRSCVRSGTAPPASVIAERQEDERRRRAAEEVDRLIDRMDPNDLAAAAAATLEAAPVLRPILQGRDPRSSVLLKNLIAARMAPRA